MDTAFISAISALAGSVVGGLTSGITTWVGQRSQALAGQRLHNLVERERLYQDFVVAASEAYGNAAVNSEPDLQRIVALHGMISRMRLLSTAPVIACAEKTMDQIIDVYFQPVMTIQAIRDNVRAGNMIDPLRELSEVSRRELQSR